MIQLSQEERHDLLVHIQWHHAVMPPYDGTPEEAHAWMHDDAEDSRDRDHAPDLITLPPRHEYATRGPRTYHSDALGRVTIPED